MCAISYMVGEVQRPLMLSSEEEGRVCVRHYSFPRTVTDGCRKYTKKRGRYMFNILQCVMRVRVCVSTCFFLMRVSMYLCVHAPYASVCCFCVLQASL